MILSNQVHCFTCEAKPFSMHRHDFQYCICGAVAVDGGTDYLRRVTSPAATFEDISIEIPDKHAKGLMDAFMDPSRNDLGKLCNVARYLRDEMGINIGDYNE